MEVKRLKLEYLSERWREVRFGLLTASNFAQAMRSESGDAFSRWSSRAELVEHYRKRKDVEQNGAMVRGLIYEPAVMKALRMYYGGGANAIPNTDGTRPNWRVQWSHGLLAAPEFRVGATPDARGICEGTTITTRSGKRIEAPRAAIQFKTCSPRVFDRHYAGHNDGPGHFSHEYNTACDDARVQVAIEAMLMRPRVDVGFVVALEIVSDAAPRLSICQVDRDPEFEEWACKFAREFWDEVEPGWKPETYEDVLYEGRMTSFHDMMRANPVSDDSGFEAPPPTPMPCALDGVGKLRRSEERANDARPSAGHTERVFAETGAPFGDGTWGVHNVDEVFYVYANGAPPADVMQYAGIAGEDEGLAQELAQALARVSFDPRNHMSGTHVARPMDNGDLWIVVCDDEEWTGSEEEMRGFAENLNIGEAMFEAAGLANPEPPPSLRVVEGVKTEPRTWPLPDDLVDGALVRCDECALGVSSHRFVGLHGVFSRSSGDPSVAFEDNTSVSWKDSDDPPVRLVRVIRPEHENLADGEVVAGSLSSAGDGEAWALFERGSVARLVCDRVTAVRGAMEANGELDELVKDATMPAVRLPPKRETRGRKSGSKAKYNRHHWYRGESKGVDYGPKRTKLRAAVVAYSSAYAAREGKNPRLNSIVAECFGQKMAEVEPTDKAAERLRQWCEARVDKDGKMIDVVNIDEHDTSNRKNEEATETEGGGMV